MAVLRQPARLLLVVIIGLAIALAVDIARIGGPYAWLAHHRLLALAAVAGNGERVDIGGRSLYLDCRGSGSPTIVLEAGMGDGVAGWLPVMDGLAATSRTCAYDRAGRGASDGHDRYAVGDAADDLHALLGTAGESPPYILVGHSLGEVYVRVFADRYRADVAGLVLVDGFSVDLEVDRIHPLLGDLRPEYEARAQGLRDLVASVEGLDWPRSETQLRMADIDGLPVVVLRAPRVEPRLDEATNAAIGRRLGVGLRFALAWAGALRDRLGGGSRRAGRPPGSGHHGGRRARQRGAGLTDHRERLTVVVPLVTDSASSVDPFAAGRVSC